MLFSRNSFRILGVLSTSGQREIVGNIHYENDNIFRSFKYDSKENWIERIAFENDVIPVEMIERAIKYYDSYKSAVASLDSLK